MARLRTRIPAVVIAALAMIPLLLIPVGTAGAVGLTAFPGTIEFDDALRGGQAVERFTFRPDVDVAQTFTISTTGTAGEWFTFALADDPDADITTFEVPAGRTVNDILVKVSVPDDAPNGSYDASVLIVGDRPVGGSGGDSSVGLNLGVEVLAQITVTGVQRIEGVVVETRAFDTEAGLPVRFIARIENTGNVVVAPAVTVDVLRGEAVVATVAAEETNVFPGEEGRINAIWDSADQLTGDYVARMSIDYAGTDLGTFEIPFELFPRGSLTRRGELTGLTLTNEPEPGGIARVEAAFTNTGEIEARPILQGQVFYEGALVSAIDSVGILVFPGERKTVDAFFEVPNAGTYTLVASMNFDGTETDELELTVVVGGTGGIPVVPVIVGGAGIVLLAGLFRLDRRRRSEPKPPRPPSKVRELPEHESVG